MKIERDRRRFQQIVRGKIRSNLRKYVNHGEMIGRKGKDLVSIPVPQLDVPHFRHGSNQGVGAGPGDVGDPLDPGDGGSGAGGDPGTHLLEVEVSLERTGADAGRGTGAAADSTQGIVDDRTT